MNNEILTIFENFAVNGVKIPVKWLKYKGDGDYIVFSGLGENPEHSADDDSEYSVPPYDFDIYTKGNYTNILKEVKSRLKTNGWTWVEDSPDMYEEDTGYYHKTTTFKKEKYLKGE